nr:DUF177 domain-containing protein [Gemmatimonadota bacterium]NIT68379.1 DUF177 domain-containing protein [Gemmatimonadota bacterium]NIW76921.1 DUF177 domain-containing protein [Gemmatimonadota bacterium]NIY36956.1 DUF177 domain-containing protein [Gemmatimonadota bacterium]
MAETPNITPEFSRIVATTELAGEEAVHRIEAGAAECAALATRFDLLALKNLAATVRLKRVRGGALVRLSADFSADVVQSCVVSLEPVSTHIEESFTVLYGPESAVAEAQEVVLEV